MKMKFTMFRRGEMFYMQDNAAGKQTSLLMKDETEAKSLLIRRGSVGTLTVASFYGTLPNMQTTIQLDDALLARATELAREKGYDLSHLIEETLRDKIAPLSPVASRPFCHLTTFTGDGIHPGVDLNNSAALLTLMEQGE